jgi:hypothetical protein
MNRSEKPTLADPLMMSESVGNALNEMNRNDKSAPFWSTDDLPKWRKLKKRNESQSQIVTCWSTDDVWKLWKWSKRNESQWKLGTRWYTHDVCNRQQILQTQWIATKNKHFLIHGWCLKATKMLQTLRIATTNQPLSDPLMMCQSDVNSKNAMNRNDKPTLVDPLMMSESVRNGPNANNRNGN